MSLSLEDVRAQVAEEQFLVLGERTTICHLTLENGFEVVGVAHTQDPDSFDVKEGRGHAAADAMDKVWKLEAYANESPKQEVST